MPAGDLWTCFERIRCQWDWLSIATSRLLNQCWASSPRQHSKCNSKCLQLKKWMDDPEFQIGAVFGLFCVSTNSDLLTFEVGCRAQIMALHDPAVGHYMGSCLDRLMSELSGKLATFSDVSCAMCYPCRYREAWQKDLQFVWKFVKTSKPSASACSDPLQKKVAYFQLSEQFSLWSSRQSSSVLDPRPWCLYQWQPAL